MESLLPLLVVIPVGAAFVIPMVSVFARKRGHHPSGYIALCGTAALVVLSFVIFAEQRVLTTWIGKWQGGTDVLGLAGPLGAASRSDGDGVRVEYVRQGSAGERAGIAVGDVVVGWKLPDVAAFQPVRSLSHLRRENAALEPGTELVLKVRRGEEALEKTMRAGKPVVGIAMVCDGLTRLMLVTISVVAFAAVLFSLSYMKDFTKVHLYYSPLMFMIAGMNGIVLSGDLFNIYVFLEVAAVASYALVGFGVESEELEASFKYLVLSAVASGFILLGIGIVYNLSGTLNLAQIAEYAGRIPSNDALWLAVGFFVAGFGLKAAMVPFHAWLPDAHPSAPAPVSAMLSGLLIKASGVYVLARLVFNVLGLSSPLAYVLIVMGSLSMLVGGLLMWGQWDVKRLLAYSSISHMGLVVLAFGVGAEALVRQEEVAQDWSALAFLAIFGGLFHLVNHAAFKSLLFLCSGSVVHRTGTRDLRRLSGMGSRMPLTSLFTRIGALSISGVPPFSGFFSKLLIVVAVVWAGHWFLGGLTVVVSLITLLAFIKVQRYLIEGEPQDEFKGVVESPGPMLAAMAILAALCIGLGVLLPLYRYGLLDPAAQALYDQLSGYALSVFGG